RWDGTSWNSPQVLTTGGTATKLSPSVAFSPGGKALAVWTEKEATQGVTTHRLKYAVFDRSANTWSNPGVITESPRFIEDPKAVVDAAGAATVIWRAYAGKSKGGCALFSSNGQMPGPVWSEPKQITDDDMVQWQADAALDNNNKVYTVWSAYDVLSGAAGAGDGFGNGVNVARENPDSAALTGVFSDTVTDEDSDGVYEALEISVGLNILVPGNYEVRGDLYKGNQLILSAHTIRNNLETGTQIFILSFPGGILSNHGLDGPYELKDVTIMDRNDSAVQADFSAVHYTTAAYQASQFIGGPLSLDKESYLGTWENALITVTDALANTSADSVQTLTVQVASTLDHKGFLLGLVETGPNTGIFQENFGFSLVEGSSELKRLLVADHDLVQVIYNDPNRDYRFIEKALWTAIGAGDVNGDGQITLEDAIITLQCAARMNTANTVITTDADVDGDGKIGLSEVIYILQKEAEIR
ncbi:MAG: dockerin type I repeat-containing protein, partial [Deltaproteobacteria bacterium]|nr:dockerin type I repeat-containing protein [Deltaproteobacteria bacterium]